MRRTCQGPGCSCVSCARRSRACGQREPAPRVSRWTCQVDLVAPGVHDRDRRRGQRRRPRGRVRHRRSRPRSQYPRWQGTVEPKADIKPRPEREHGHVANGAQRHAPGAGDEHDRAGFGGRGGRLRDDRSSSRSRPRSRSSRGPTTAPARRSASRARSAISAPGSRPSGSSRCAPPSRVPFTVLASTSWDRPDPTIVDTQGQVDRHGPAAARRAGHRRRRHDAQRRRPSRPHRRRRSSAPAPSRSASRRRIAASARAS